MLVFPVCLGTRQPRVTALPIPFEVDQYAFDYFERAYLVRRSPPLNTKRDLHLYGDISKIAMSRSDFHVNSGPSGYISRSSRRSGRISRSTLARMNYGYVDVVLPCSKQQELCFFAACVCTLFVRNSRKWSDFVVLCICRLELSKPTEKYQFLRNVHGPIGRYNL
ncbi:hypothetical protein BKA93DRAFT_549555 [Sparassis latifolia]|uniref:Uncharacterized protein n=1 Tax=Sparassis crispa TaxID=139825 RepID=A0A401GW16_9APHY|nr:hypothetical protein SCP_0902950 [Sparassis crispa]GBE86416.1 hypothetical protein SCP_0902950 [Sparassis crispa]